MYRFICLIGVLLTSATATRGAEEEILSLSSAFQTGLRNHPSIISADADLKVRLAQSLAITEIPNPRLEAEFRALTDRPVIDLKLMQPIKRSYFGLRQNYALAERASAKAEVRAQIVGVLNDIYGAYIELWTVQQLQTIRDRNRQDFLSLREPFEKRVKAGQGGAVDLSLLDAEIANEQAERDALDSQRLARSAALSRRLGRTGGTMIRVDRPSGLALPQSSTSLEKFAIARTPLRLALIKREEAALARLAVARSDRYGNMEAGLIAEHDTANGGLTLGIGFTFDLPVWNQNQAAIAEAEASAAAARSELRALEPARVSAIVKLRYLSARKAEASAASYRQEVIPRFETALDQARESIAKGQGEVILIQPLVNRLTETRMRAFELEVAAIEARAELEAALGGRLEEALATSVR